MVFLEGKQVLITISDPWSFVTNNGDTRLGTIAAYSKVITISLKQPVSDGEVSTNLIYAKFRHLGSLEKDLKNGMQIACNFSDALAEDNLHLKHGVINFIGGLQLLLD